MVGSRPEFKWDTGVGPWEDKLLGRIAPDAKRPLPLRVSQASISTSPPGLMGTWSFGPTPPCLAMMTRALWTWLSRWALQGMAAGGGVCVCKPASYSGSRERDLCTGVGGVQVRRAERYLLGGKALKSEGLRTHSQECRAGI